MNSDGFTLNKKISKIRELKNEIGKEKDTPDCFQ